MTAEQWRADNQRLLWAQQNPIYRELLAVMINGRPTQFASSSPIPPTENRMLGFQEGYEYAVNLFRGLTEAFLPPPPSLEETYERPENIPPHGITD